MRRSHTSEQSKLEKSPPHTAKLPAAPRRDRNGLAGWAERGGGWASAARRRRGGVEASPARRCGVLSLSLVLCPGGGGGASEDRRPRADRRDAALHPLAARAVARPLDHVPEAAADGAHRKRAANVVEDPVRARVPLLHRHGASRLRRASPGSQCAWRAAAAVARCWRREGDTDDSPRRARPSVWRALNSRVSAQPCVWALCVSVALALPRWLLRARQRRSSARRRRRRAHRTVSMRGDSCAVAGRGAPAPRGCDACSAMWIVLCRVEEKLLYKTALCAPPPPPAPRPRRARRRPPASLQASSGVPSKYQKITLRISHSVPWHPANARLRI